MIKRFLYLIVFVSLLSCSSKNKAPSSIIQPEEMKSVLWDVMRAQNLAISVSRSDTTTNTIAETKALTQRIFEIHKISAEDFNKSYNWYLRHPELMKVMFDSLYNQKQRANKLQSDQQALHDSSHHKIPEQ